MEFRLEFKKDADSKDIQEVLDFLRKKGYVITNGFYATEIQDSEDWSGKKMRKYWEWLPELFQATKTESKDDIPHSDSFGVGYLNE